jgi:5-oxoprolinase (ATP-hydrolysing) subunit A
MKRSIDFTTEMGEGFALPPFGLSLDFWRAVETKGERIHPRQFMQRFDDELMPHVSSASVACGVHSGDPAILGSVVERLAVRGTAVGAHPSYPDPFRFGQKRVEMTPAELEASILFQLGALGAIAKGAGKRLQHVWCHGALGFDVSFEPGICDVMLGAIRKYDPELALVMMVAGAAVPHARKSGIRIAELAFLDRGYGAEGRIVPRSHPEALLKSAAAVEARVKDIVQDGVVRAVDGTPIPADVDMILLHCDTPGAADMAQGVVRALARLNIPVRPLRL